MPKRFDIVAEILDFASDRTVTIALSVILISSVCLLLHLGFVALTLLCSLSVVSTFYTMIWLEGKNNRMVGGLPRATYFYRMGYFCMASGYIGLSVSFIYLNPTLRIVGAVSLLSGFFMALYASKTVFEATARRGVSLT